MRREYNQREADHRVGDRAQHEITQRTSFSWGFGNPHPMRISLFLAALLILLCNFAYAETLALQSIDGSANDTLSNPDRSTAPVVSNVSASQRTDGSKIVDIYYDLYDANVELCDITFKLSSNNGSSYDICPTVLRTQLATQNQRSSHLDGDEGGMKEGTWQVKQKALSTMFLHKP